MKYINIIIIFVMMLSACTPNELDNCAGYGCNYDAVTETGIQYRSDIIGNTFTKPNELDIAYNSVSNCLGLWNEPNILVIVNDNISEYDAVVFYPPSLFVMRDEPYLWTRIEKLKRMFVSHYMYILTGSTNFDPYSELFEKCVYYDSNELYSFAEKSNNGRVNDNGK